MWRLGRVRRALRSTSRAGGISLRSLEVKMSARFALERDFLAARTSASASDAPTPRVFPEKSTDSILSVVGYAERYLQLYPTSKTFPPGRTVT